MELLTVEEAMQAMKIGRTLLYRLIGTGEMPSVLVGGARRIPKEDLERFIESRREPAKGAAE